jgi:hypothetical protein
VLGDNNTVNRHDPERDVIKPIISNLWSNSDANVSATATVMRSVNKLEVALVLDNTGSMASTLGSGGKKIDALITPPSRWSTSWPPPRRAPAKPTRSSWRGAVLDDGECRLDLPGQSWITGRAGRPATAPTCSRAATGSLHPADQLGLTWGGCVESRPAPYDVNDDGRPADARPRLFVPFFAPDEPDDNTVNKPSTRIATSRTPHGQRRHDLQQLDHATWATRPAADLEHAARRPTPKSPSTQRTTRAM